MTAPETAFAVMKEADPASDVIWHNKLSVDQALVHAQTGATGIQVPEGHAWRKRPAVVAATAFAVVLLIGLFAAYLLGDPSEVVEDPVVTTTPVVTTVPAVPTTFAATATTIPVDSPPPTIGDAEQSLVEAFAVAYSSGDFETFTALFAEEVRMVDYRDRDEPLAYRADVIGVWFQIDAELNTAIELINCEPLVGDRVSCNVSRTDDLVRALQLESPSDVRYVLGFEDGLVVSWDRRTPEEEDWNTLANGPFLQWVAATYPEIPDPKPFRDAPYRTDTGFEDVIAELAAEWIATLESNPG